MDYTNLIYSPLDIADSPDINIKDFTEWMVDNEIETTTKVRYTEIHKKEYPWVVVSFNADSNTKVAEEFRNKFPQLYKHLDNFPIVGDRVLVFLAQKGDHDIFLHGDADGFGYRFHITNTNNEHLFFHMSKDPSKDLPQSVQNWDLIVDTSTKFIAKRPTNRCAFVINSKLACHGVETNRASFGDRIACLVYPSSPDKVDKNKQSLLIQRSIKKFPDYQIWYKKP